MDAPNKELSPALSTSAPSGKGLKGVLKKARLGRKDDASTISLNGSDEGNTGGLRNSVESLLDRARDNRSSLDDGLPSGPSNLSKLIPGRVKKKLKKREEAEQQQELGDGRGRSVEDQTATAVESKTQPGNKSRDTLGEDAESLITVESDTESPAVSPMRPATISHPSHIGYLTSSSPLIKTTPIAEGPSNLDLDLDSPNFQSPQYQKSNTLPTTTSTPSLASSLAPQHAATMDTRDGGRTLSTADGNRSRGVSPGARVKEVFAIGSKKNNSSPPKSPDRSSLKSLGNGGALGALFNKDKRGSMKLGRSSKASESTQSIDTSPRSPNDSTRDLPTIVTTPNNPISAGLETPETNVTPPTPTDQRQEPPGSPSLGTKAAISSGTNANTITSPSGNMISHRRVRSDPATQAPSKLSSVMSAPLTPMTEETKTLGARSPSASSGPGAAGFFSSVFAAAQNAANQLSDTIANNNQTRSRSSTQNTGAEVVSDVDGSIAVIGQSEDAPMGEEKKLAVDTLGTGDLSLSHLGIADSPGANSITSLSNGVQEKTSLAHREEAAARAEDVSAARAVSQAYTEKPSSENISTPVAEDVVPGPRPRSTHESSIMTGDKTPPNGSLYEGDHGLRRSGSVRSRVGTIAKRHRNSSSATGGTIGAAIAAGNAALANPAPSGGTHKLTGFAVATKKRNRDFHQLFRSVPEDDYLIEDYSCALQRDIILAGRMYVSEGHICFSSNILGWVTTLIINYDEIVSIEKESTAMVFPNAIAIQTLHARHTFRSLLSREATYDLLIGIWKINHPSLKSSLNGVRLDQGGTGDKTEKADPTGSDENSDVTEDEEEDIYDEDEEEDEETGSFTEVPEGSIVGSDIAPDQQSKAVARKASAMGVAAGAAAGGVPTPSEAKAGEKAAAASAASVDFPGPATHAPTECGDSDTHFDKFLKDEVIPAPLGKVFSMVFGTASGGFMAKWLLDEVKVTDLQLEDDKKGLSEDNKVRNFSYIKPLYASIGPKSTKCVVTETLDFLDLERCVSVTQSTQTPDVPSGNVFATKTRCCLMWAPGNSTRVLMNFTIEWTGKSWLKGPIEKGAADGQLTYCNDLVKALKAGVTSRPRAGTNGSKLKKGGKRRKGDATPSSKSPSEEKAAASAQAQDNSWGLLEPLHGILGPIVDIFSPMISSNMIIGFLLFIMLINYLRSPKTSSTSLAYPGIPSSQRIAAYEEIWRREESDLWDWLEQRVCMQDVSYPVPNSDAEALKRLKKQRQQSLKGKEVRRQVEGMRMSEREVENAIRVTEEKLGVLKRAVEEGKGEKSEKGAEGPDGGGSSKSLVEEVE